MNLDSFHLDGDRVVISSGGGCGHGCVYCLSHSVRYKPRERSSEAMLAQLEDLCKNSSLETIQLGYDAEPFNDPEKAVSFIRKVAALGKNITFATKAELSDTTSQSLGEIYTYLRVQNKYLCGLVSMSSWESAARLEPYAPPPNERLNTIRRLHQYGVPSMVVLRPLLPFVSTNELKQVLSESKSANAQAAIIGGFYLDNGGQIVARIIKAGFKVDQSVFKSGKLPWSTNPNEEWYIFHDPRVRELSEYAVEIELPAFKQTIEAVNQVIIKGRQS